MFSRTAGIGAFPMKANIIYIDQSKIRYMDAANNLKQQMMSHNITWIKFNQAEFHNLYKLGLFQIGHNTAIFTASFIVQDLNTY